MIQREEIEIEIGGSIPIWKSIISRSEKTHEKNIFSFQRLDFFPIFFLSNHDSGQILIFDFQGTSQQSEAQLSHYVYRSELSVCVQVVTIASTL